MGYILASGSAPNIVALVQSDLNRDSQQGSIYIRLDRIKKLLDLVDPPAE